MSDETAWNDHDEHPGGEPLTQDELDQIADGWPMDDDEPYCCGLDECDCHLYAGGES